MKRIYRIYRNGRFATDSVTTRAALDSLECNGVIGASNCGDMLENMRRGEFVALIAHGLGDTAIIQVQRIA